LDEMVRTIAPTWYAQVATPPGDGPQPAPSQERMKRELGTLLQEISRVEPVLLVIDDLHWADVSTVDAINYLAGRFAGMRVLVVTGYRPSDMARTSHPFGAIRSDLQSRGVFEEIPLAFLKLADVDRYLALAFPDRRFPRGFAAMIHEKTEGSPLFMADLTRW